MAQPESKAFSILASSILSKPRMMGTPAESETTDFLLTTLKAAGLSPYTEEIQWSNAFVVARKILIILFIPWLAIFNISLRVDGIAGEILSILTPLLALFFLFLAGKAVLDDKFSYLGKTSPGRNVICDLPPSSGKTPERTIYLTAHTDSVGSSLPKLNMPLTIGSMVFFLVALVSTLVGGVSNFTGSGSVSAIRIWFILIVTVADIILIVFSIFAKRVNTSPGAIDNGSGSAILLSLAHEFNKEPLQNIALRFIFCAAEEWGLYGSKGYVKDHREELEAGVGRDQVINVDMVGSELAYVEKAGLIIKKPFNKNLNSLIAEIAEEIGIEARAFSTAFVGNSDHAPFRKMKMETAFFLSKKDTRKIHKPMDRIEKVDPRKLDDAVALIAAVVKEIDKG